MEALRLLLILLLAVPCVDGLSLHKDKVAVDEEYEFEWEIEDVPVSTGTAIPFHPTFAPSPAQGLAANTAAPTVTSVQVDFSSSRKQEVTALLSSRFGDLTLLESADTPQGMAAQWMAELDPAVLPIPDANNYANAYRFVQRYSLAVIYFSLSQKSTITGASSGTWNGTLLPFLTADNECNWNLMLDMADGTGMIIGVQCNELGEVTSITMPSLGLTGNIPTELGLLLALTSLVLPYNQLDGPLPTQFQYLTSLALLDLQQNAVSGTLPIPLQGLKELTTLNLAGNMLTGPLPDVTLLTRLTALSLQNNQLSGDDLTTLNQLSSLESLRLGGNLFSGTLDGLQILKLTNLRELDLSSNSFYRNFPPAKPFNNSTSTATSALEFLRLQNNQFAGLLDLTQFPALIGLDVSNNKFTGVMSNVISSLPNLQYLSLSNNPWQQGTFPSWEWTASQLREMSLSQTNLIGNLPSWLGTATQLQLLRLDGNRLQGELPASLGALVDLRFLLVNDNELAGTLPAVMIYLQALEVLRVDGNTIGGTALPICGVQTPKLLLFVADCALLECTCCTHCSETYQEMLIMETNTLMDTTWTRGLP